MRHQETSNDSGYMSTFSPRPGMHLNLADFKPAGTIETRFEMRDSSIRFAFFLTGSGYWEFRSSRGEARINMDTCRGRHAYISYCPEGEAKICFPGRHRHFHVCVSVRPSLLAAYFDGRWERVPREFRDICEGYAGDGFYHCGSVSPVMNMAIQHLLVCPYVGSMRELYLEGKAIELIAHKMAQIATAESLAASPLGLRKDDMERIRHAKDILGHDLENPPGLFELARAVGMTHTKLNRGFREVFGTTVFGHLRKMRLDVARRLLEEEGMNVTEAALNVGYNSVSSFSRAFSDYFGLNPKRFQRKGR